MDRLALEPVPELGLESVLGLVPELGLVLGLAWESALESVPVLVLESVLVP